MDNNDFRAGLPGLSLAVLLTGLVSPAWSNEEARNSAATKAESRAEAAEARPGVTEVSPSRKAATIEATESVPETSLSQELEKDWVCRKETPTGSHRAIKACRKKADIEADSEEVARTMDRQRHYGNPSVTPQG